MKKEALININHGVRRTGILFFVVIFLLFEGISPARSEILTLEEAIRYGLDENRQAQNAAWEVDKTEDQIAAARTKRFPALELYVMESRLLKTLDFEFKKGVFGNNSVIGPIPAKDTTIDTEPRFTTYALAQLTQPLSQQYRIGLGIDYLKVSKDLTHEALRISRHTVTNEIKHDYFGILGLQSTLKAARETVSFYRELRRVVENFVRQGTALEVDRMEVEANLSRAEDEKRTLENAIRSRKENLNRLMGRDIETAFDVVSVPEPAPFEIDGEEAVSKALMNRPELKETRLRVQQAEYGKRLKKAEYIPDLNLSLNYGRLHNVEVLPEETASVGLVLTWEFFDWGRKRRELGEREHSILQTKNNLRETEALILSDIHFRLRKLEEGRSAVDTARLMKETSRERLRITVNRYRDQAALLKDVLQDEASYRDETRNFDKAVLDLWTARADLEKAMGED